MPRYLKNLLIGVLFLGTLSSATLSVCKQVYDEESKSVALCETTINKGNFDYYVLALSWSPYYCRNHQADKEQCGRKPDDAYRFILHGLWPNNKGAKNPFNCSNQKLSDDIIEQLLPIIPSTRLIKHEWKKHGTCSGLTPEQYFSLARNAFEKIKIPAVLDQSYLNIIIKSKKLKDLFIQANPHLKYDSIRVINHSGELVEIRVCLDKKLAPIVCPLPIASRADKELAIFMPGSHSLCQDHIACSKI